MIPCSVWMRRFLIAASGTVAAIGLFASGTAAAASAEAEDVGHRVLVTRVDTPITPVVADHVRDGLARADEGGYAAYVIELDTPGGLVEAMRDIVASTLASPVPVIVYVSPEGARAGSAGAIITFAAHVAVMAPGTTIGAATPVGLEGESVSDKIVNDSAAQAEALATLRGRDVGFAVDTVRDGRSAAVDEALELGAIDAKASSLTAALDAADGLTVTLAADRELTVSTAGAQVERLDMGPFRRALQALANPNIAFLLMTLGTLGLIYELATPGVGVAGATGAVALLLALFSLSVLPVTVVGLLLFAVAIALFVAEVLAPGIAGFAFGGAVVLVLSALFLFDDAEGVAVDPSAALPLGIVMFLAAVVAGRLAFRTRSLPSTTTGADLLLHRLVPVQEGNGATGRGFTEGTWWSLRSVGRALHAGDTARVVGIDGVVLLVEPLAPGATGAPGSPGEPSDQGKDMR